MRCIVLLLGLIFLLSGSGLHAQSLEEGTWVGRMIAPSGKIDTLYLHVDQDAGMTKVEIELDTQDRRFVGTDIEVDEYRLAFKWSFDININCTLLAQENASYQGMCTDALGNKGPLTFLPPSMKEDQSTQRIFDDWAYYWKGRNY